MHHIIDTTTGMTALEPRKWLRGVDKACLLNLLWVSHYSRTPIIVLVIKQLLCLLRDGCPWLEELIPITDILIHRITQLPYTGSFYALKERLAQLAKLEEERILARFHQQVQKQREKAWHDRPIKLCTFKVNDLVLLYDKKFEKILVKFRI